MNTSLTRLILGKIGEIGKVTFDGFFPKKYSYARLTRTFLGIDSYPRVTPQTVASLLSRLKRQGLVERQGSKGSSSWLLTDQGRQLLKKSEPIIPLKDNITRLVIFDIPERERKKRDIIRMELVGCGFQLLQQSVWIGHNPLPEDFIERIDTLRLKNNVRIFSVRDVGTLEG